MKRRFRMDLGLKGKTVVVTGAGSNIGRGILLEFAREGSRVVAAEKDEVQGKRVVDEAVMIRTDVTDWDSVQAMVKETVSRFGQIDVLVNNAGGTTSMAPFIKKKREEWDQEIKLNYWGVINCTRAVLDNMIEHKHGRIVNVASASGQVGLGAIDCAVYGGTKGGVIALARALAWELGRYGITVNVASPGWIVPERPDHTGGGSFWKQWGYDYFTPERLKAAVKYWPVPRLGTPEDMAASVVFLASERASFLTGQTICVGGGVAMW
jgi:2-hydroxycyclohexanecarboxyl-CoA dehydrogenase